MRLYTFVNFYLSSIQQGIQTAHLVHELFTKYKAPITKSSKSKMLYDWANNHKTIITLNGGANEDIEDVFKRLSIPKMHNYPFASFNEDHFSLGGVMTCCGIVVGPEVYEAKSFFNSPLGQVYHYKKLGGTEEFYYPNTAMWDIVNMIKSKSLAR